MGISKYNKTGMYTDIIFDIVKRKKGFHNDNRNYHSQS
jgi:hypothetical protein